MEALTQRRNAAVIRSRSGRIYRLAAVSPGVGLPSVYWAYLGPSFQQATWRQRLAAEDVQAAFATGRAVEGLTQAEAEAMTAATRPPQPAPDRVPARRGKKSGRGGASAPVVSKSPAQALHLDLVREGFRTQSERYALATAALGRPVASFSALTPDERNAVRDAAFAAYA
ncbi:MAG: hypothetical protein IAE99_08005 [Rhodothermales bacterium]|nr:hypothetical protein [Rhodothermales bacterium]